MSLIPDRKQTVSVAVALASAILLGSVAAVLIAAAPMDRADEASLTASLEPVRIMAPVGESDLDPSPLDPAVTYPAENAAETTGVAAVKPDAPETIAVPETTAAPETTRAPETTAAPVTTKAPETTAAPETDAPTEAAQPEATKAPAVETQPEEPAKKSGCGAVISGSAIIGAVILAVPVFVRRKRK